MSMDEQPGTDQTPDPALIEMWRKYRGWALRARTIRNDLDRWQLYVLVLTVAGAVLATLAAQIEGWDWQRVDVRFIARVLSGVSAVAMALAAYWGRSVLDPGRERQWLRARALAELCKSDSYRYATQAPPYDTAGAGERLLQRLQEFLSSAADIPAAEVEEFDARKRLPSFPLAINAYVTERVKDQVDDYYRPRAAKNEKSAERCAQWVQVLSAAAAVLGALGATAGAAQVTAWVAVIGTVSAAVGAFALSQRYQRLAAVYRVTADRLAVRLALWRIARVQPGDMAAVDRALVVDCETIMAGENEAWMAEFLKDPNAPATAAGAGQG